MTIPTPTPSLTDCPPRFGTPRDYSRATLGGQVAKIAEQLGTPFMPWQQYVADVALEIDPDTGRLYYGEVDLTVPRQSGKTTLILALAVHRALAWGTPQNIVYTAQTRNDARKKWEDDHVEALKRSIFKRKFAVRLSNGAEAIKWFNGSRHGISAGTEKSGHGSTLDLGFIDEAFAQIDSRGEQAMKPAMITRPGSQFYVVSTAGTAASVYLRAKVDKGRARVLAGQSSRVAYFEWSADDKDDPSERAVWRRTMPALGHTVTEDDIQTEFDGMDEDDFCRAFLNQWRDGKAAKQVIPVADWTDCQDEDSQLADPASDPIAIAIAATPDLAWSAIALGGVRADGLDHGEVINHKAGTEWVVGRVLELRERRNVIGVVVDPAGPAGFLIADLEAAGVEVTKVTARDLAHACGGLYTATTRPPDAAPEWASTFRHRGQASLNAALAAATKRPLGDAWAWQRKGAADICPLEAVTLARHARGQHVEAAAYSVLDSFY
jgi:phage terminase large subunit-like protein